jgi:hypothetical protein
MPIAGYFTCKAEAEDKNVEALGLHIKIAMAIIFMNSQALPYDSRKAPASEHCSVDLMMLAHGH